MEHQNQETSHEELCIKTKDIYSNTVNVSFFYYILKCAVEITGGKLKTDNLSLSIAERLNLCMITHFISTTDIFLWGTVRKLKHRAPKM